jgi:uncharacterized protein YfaS (alpha-2-macroglobulin family)
MRLTSCLQTGRRAFVVAVGSSGAARYGSAETSLVVRRSLSLTAAVPRFVRVTDTFEAGVVVTVGSAPASVTVTVQVRRSRSRACAAAAAAAGVGAV